MNHFIIKIYNDLNPKLIVYTYNFYILMIYKSMIYNSIDIHKIIHI